MGGVELLDSDGSGSAAGRWRAWAKGEVIRCAVFASRLPGFALLLIGSYAIGLGSNELATTRVMMDWVDPMHAPSSTWAAMNGLVVCGLLLVTTPRLRTGPDLVAVTGAVWTVACTAVFSWVRYAAEFWFPDRQCRFSSCWPGVYQPAAIAAPVVVSAGLLVVVMATVGRRRSWLVRALWPTGVFVVLTLVQVAVWERYVVPFFHTAPRF